MDPDLKAALDRVTEAVDGSTRAAQASTAATLDLKAAVESIDRRVGVLEKHVFPGEPPTLSAPPPAATIAELAIQAARQASDANLELDAYKAKAATETSTFQAWVRAELQKQSNAMGIGIRGLQWLVTAEGRSVALRAATLAGVAYAAFHVASHYPPPVTVVTPPAPVVLPAPAGSQ